MNIRKYAPMLTGLGITLTISTTSHAGPLCNWFGIDCDPVAATGRSADDNVPTPTLIDQNTPPEVFSFTVSATFDEWSDIPPEPFICDTRAEADRSCTWYGHIPEIKRNAAIELTPYPHELGMYKVKAWIEHNLGRDTKYRARVGIDAPEFAEAPGMLSPVSSGISITDLSQYPLEAQILQHDPYELNRRKTPYGHITMTFKEALK